MSKLLVVMALLLLNLFSLGMGSSCARTASAQQQTESTRELANDTQVQVESPVDTAPPIPNGVNIGGISIGIVDFERKSNRILMGFVCRRINEGGFPRGFSLRITDDRGNEYNSKFRIYDFWPLPVVGSTWTPSSPIGIKVPEVAPISKFELIPETETMLGELRGTIPESFSLDYQKLTPLLDLGLDFKIEPEQILTGKEVKQSEHISIWFEEPKVEEETAYYLTGVNPFEKVISVSVPVTIENRDYNPRTAEMRWQLQIQLNTGKIPSGSVSMSGSTTVGALSRQTVEYSFNANVDENEYVQLIWLDLLPPGIPMPGVFPVVPSDRSPTFAGFLFSQRVTMPPEMALGLPIRNSLPRQLVPPSIQDGDYFPDGSKIVYSKQIETETGYFGTTRLLYRIFVMNSDGTDDKEIGLKQATSEIISSIGYEDHVAPLVSPDGQKIAFVVNRHDHPASIYVMDADGNNIQQAAPYYSDSLAYAWISNDKIANWSSIDCYDNFDINYLYEYGNVYTLDISVSPLISAGIPKDEKANGVQPYSIMPSESYHNDGNIQKIRTPPPELLEGKFISGCLGTIVEDLKRIEQ